MPKAADQQHQPAARKGSGRVTGAISFICIVLFVSNVLAGKAVVSFGWEAPILLGNAAEFLLLLVGVVFFVITTLQLEARDKP